MSRRRRAVVALVTVLVFAIQACGDDTSTTSGSGGAPTTDAVPSGREGDERVGDQDARERDRSEVEADEALVAQCDLGPAPEEPDPEVEADPVEFDVEDEVAYMYGIIGSDIVHRTCDLLRDNPDLEILEVVDVPGSSTFGNETLEAGLVVAAAGVATLVPGDGQIESGGVDYFMAGEERIVENGACLGVHSTAIEGDDGSVVAAADLPRDDPEHQAFLEYFRAVGVPEDFYWFTLEAASPEGIHYLTPAEMVEFEVTTGPPPTEPCPLPDDP